jgi:hypothetical protein
MNTIKQILLDAGLRPRIPSPEAIGEVEEDEQNNTPSFRIALVMEKSMYVKHDKKKLK